MKFPKSLLNDVTHYNLRKSTHNWLINLSSHSINPIISFSNFYILYYNNQVATAWKPTIFNEYFANRYVLPLITYNKDVRNTTIKKNLFLSTNKLDYQSALLPNTKQTNNYKTNLTFKSSLLWNLFDIYFLRKERVYTKLKYSRVPQYDIVSGGSAALFAGFLGFLICEKFGVELVDSGDLYIVFMYVVFLCFALKMLLKIMEADALVWNFFSYKWLILFYYQLLSLSYIKIYNFFNHFWRYLGRY